MTYSSSSKVTTALELATPIPPLFLALSIGSPKPPRPPLNPPLDPPPKN